MNKIDINNRLNKLKGKCEIAELLVDISSHGKLVYPNESILVVLTPDADKSEIIYSYHYTTCDSIEDFDAGIVFGEGEARKAYCNYYVSDFICIRPFISDMD